MKILVIDAGRATTHRIGETPWNGDHDVIVASDEVEGVVLAYLEKPEVVLICATVARQAANEIAGILKRSPLTRSIKVVVRPAARAKKRDPGIEDVFRRIPALEELIETGQTAGRAATT